MWPRWTWPTRSTRSSPRPGSAPTSPRAILRRGLPGGRYSTAGLPVRRRRDRNVRGARVAGLSAYRFTGVSGLPVPAGRARTVTARGPSPAPGHDGVPPQRDDGVLTSATISEMAVGRPLVTIVTRPPRMAATPMPNASLRPTSTPNSTSSPASTWTSDTPSRAIATVGVMASAPRVSARVASESARTSRPATTPSSPNSMSAIEVDHTAPGRRPRSTSGMSDNVVLQVRVAGSVSVSISSNIGVRRDRWLASWLSGGCSVAGAPRPSPH